MKKPSIYSDVYRSDNRKRTRKRNRFVILALFLALMLFFVPYLVGKISEYKALGGKFNKPAAPPASVVLEASYPLSEGGEVTIEYTKTGDNIAFNKVSGIEEKYKSDISPDKKKVLISEKVDSSIYVINSDFSAKDWSMASYKGKDNVVIKKADKVGTDFIWAKQATFLEDNIIIYISNLTQSDKPLTVRSIDLTTGFDNEVSGIQGNSIEIKGLTKEGLVIILDGEEKLLGTE